MLFTIANFLRFRLFLFGIPFPNNVKRSIVAAIEALADDPRPEGVTKLTAKHDLYRIREGGYRIVYEVLDKKLIVHVAKVGDRKEIYQKLERVYPSLLQKKKKK